MPELTIDTLDDPRLEPYRNLPNSRTAERSGRFIVEGYFLTQRLLASDFPVESILVTESTRDRIVPHLPAGTLVFVAPKDVVSEIVGFRFHRGVLGCGRRAMGAKLDDIVPARKSPTTLVICPDIRTPENLGNVLRACSAFGVDGVLLGERCVDPLSRRVLRVSMGAALKVPIVLTQGLSRDVDRLKDEFDVQLVAAVLDETAEPLATTRRPNRLALCLGSEGHGLGPEWINRCDRRLTIPMGWGTDSLNVAMACGIFLYHFTQSVLPDTPKTR